jgi:hypothetical protein
LLISTRKQTFWNEIWNSFWIQGEFEKISGFEFLGCYKSTPLKMNLGLEIRLRRVMGIALLQLHIFTLQTLRGDGTSTKSILSGASGCWLQTLILATQDHLQASSFRLAATLLKKHWCQHANLSLANSHMDSFLDWSSSASSTELGWLLLI